MKGANADVTESLVFQPIIYKFIVLGSLGQDPISFGAWDPNIKKLWEKWNIRSFVLLSLFLQFFLLFTASLRKKTAYKWVTFIIWTAYLLADWAASFAVGLVFDSEEKYTSRHDKMDDDTGLLLVLWAPFLLLLVGGQDRITSFAVQDNELWLRHLIWLIFQLSTTGFVFIQTIHQNRLWIPTLLLLLAGTIKYAERTVALYLASSESFGISVLKEPNPGPNYEKLMRAYSTFKDTGLPTKFECLEDEEGRVSQVGKFLNPKKLMKLTNIQLVQYAYGLSNMYKGLIVNLMFSSSEHKKSRDFFSRIDAEDALRILEIELNFFSSFFYDLLHTKVAVATSKVGIISQCISIGLVVAALSLFYKEEKRGFQRFDVEVTYTLFFGVLGLNMVTLLLWVFSDWAIASLTKSQKNSLLSKIFNKFLNLKKPRWKESAGVSKLSHGKTTIRFRRWSETLSQFNFIKYCWKHRSKGVNAESRNIISITSILKYFHIKDFIDHKKNDIFQMIFVSPQPLTKNLWEFIFKELEEKSRDAEDPEAAKRLISARGEWVLENFDFPNGFKRSILMSYVNDVAYDESLLLWHIATELCYNTDPLRDRHSDCKSCDYCNAREISHCLSDYMIYLLYQQPSLMSEVSGIAKQRFRDTWAEAQRFFSQRQRELERLEEPYQCILEVDTILKPVQVKGNLSKSVLFDANMLAKETQKLDSEKWKVTSKVWVELLSYAASRSRGNAHVQQLSRGGENLTFVWLLMAQFGMRESWVETRFGTKLIVCK
ncbi:hypothetical protein ACB092_03G056100 [Castanea dentata]